jgi:hypothetical protein
MVQGPRPGAQQQPATSKQGQPAATSKQGRATGMQCFGGKKETRGGGQFVWAVLSAARATSNVVAAVVVVVVVAVTVAGVVGVALFVVVFEKSFLLWKKRMKILKIVTHECRTHTLQSRVLQCFTSKLTRFGQPRF